MLYYGEVDSWDEWKGVDEDRNPVDSPIRLFILGIIYSGIAEKDYDYLYGDNCKRHCESVGIDHSYLLKLRGRDSKLKPLNRRITIFKEPGTHKYIKEGGRERHLMLKRESFELLKVGLRKTGNGKVVPR